MLFDTMPKRLSFVVAVFLLFASFIAFMVEWDYSPFQRVAAWSTLRFSTYANETEATQALHTLVADNTLQGEALVTEADRYGISLEVKTVDTAMLALPYTTQLGVDPYFLAESKYIHPLGETGIQEVYTKQLQQKDNIVKTYTENGTIIKEPNTPTEYTGTLSKSVLEQNLNTQWKAFGAAVTNKQVKTLEELLAPDEAKQIPALLALPDLTYRVNSTLSFAFEVKNNTVEKVEVGVATITLSQCSVKPTFTIVYNKNTHVYLFAGVQKAVSELCKNPKTLTNPISCKTCAYAPVNKQYGLSSAYIPSVVATGVNGGGYVTPDTKIALQKMFAAAQAAGLTPRVSSSYRSYTVQNDLFNTYVRNEQNAGLTYIKAIEKANTYSAKPGHSEHQLGTTVDIVACSYPCSFYDAGNTAWYAWLQNNAHLYGFAISYPNGSQAYTGYIYEPWHIRYIGVDLAKELHGKGYLTKKGYYLYHYLVEKRLW